MAKVGADRIAVGDVAPRIALTDLNGGAVAVEPSTSAATIVVFTSNGCPYALAWHDRIQDVARDYQGRGVTMVQIVANDEQLQPLDSADGMAARLQRGEIEGLFLRDASQRVARAFGAVATPEIFVADREGVVRYHGAPDGDYDDPTQRACWLRRALDEMLAGEVVSIPDTSPAGCSLKWRVELLWWAGCPSHQRAIHRLTDVLDATGRHDVRVQPVEVTSPEQARDIGFVGSPSFFVGGADLFPASHATPALACRTYTREDGRSGPLPSADQLAERLRTTLPRPWELPGWTDFRQKTAPQAAERE